VDVALARDELGLGPAPTWAQVRIAYRAQIAASHPDRVGGDPARAAVVTEAYATLERAHREGRLADLRPAPPSAPPPAPPPPAAPLDEPPEVLDGDTVHLAVPPDEAFVRLVDACHRIGDVTYIDRSCAILEALLPVEGEGVCSLVITLQGRADGTDAFCTLEAIEHVASPPVRPVVERLVHALRHPER
jgi:hypothetical protein